MAVCCLAGLAWGGARRWTSLDTARWVDLQQQLKERLSTALELSGTPGGGEWKRLVVSDAAAHARSLDPQKLVPLAWPRGVHWLLLALVACAGLGFVPPYRSKAHLERAKELVVMKDVGRNLGELMRKELVQKTPAIPTTQKAMEQVAEFGDQLGQARLSRSEAMREVASLTDRLARQEGDLERSNPALKQLERAAREPGGNTSGSAESLQKQIDSLKQALGDAAAKADRLDQLSKDLEALKTQAAGAAGKPGQAGSAARQQLAQSLSDLSRRAHEAGASLDSLDEAIKALAADSSDLFLKDLEMATHDLEKMRDMAKAMQQLQDQAGKLGKDLGEQLQKAQGQAAIRRLQEMIEQLNKQGLSPEQLQKLIKEVAEAAKPGSQYGQVGERLKQAAQKAGAGDKPGAAQNLAQAQQELQKLLDALADAQSLQSTLDALARAQSALGQCKSWGECQSPGSGRGGKPGRGVGTWADDLGWNYFNQSQMAGWDNSGLQRPDTAPKGVSDRPADLDPGLVPDKVRGQISPGGSMPSITLKGVSIKGTSRVQFEEAATAAQKEAQSALNQDRVPRSYQNAVRDYFDDLKK